MLVNIFMTILVIVLLCSVNLTLVDSGGEMCTHDNGQQVSMTTAKLELEMFTRQLKSLNFKSCL